MVAESRRTIGYTRSYTHTHTRLGLMHTTERTHKHKYAHAHSLKQSFLPVTLNQLYNFSHEILNTLFVSHVQLHGDAHTHTNTHTDVDPCPQLPKHICFASFNHKSKNMTPFSSLKYESTL